MVAQTPWCELCRFDDLLLARAVATSIAAMEFDVRLCSADRAPHVVQVVTGDWWALSDVLDEIIDEQQEFDPTLAQRSSATRHARLVTIITLTGAADLLLMLGLLEW